MGLGPSVAHVSMRLGPSLMLLGRSACSPEKGFCLGESFYGLVAHSFGLTVRTLESPHILRCHTCGSACATKNPSHEDGSISSSHYADATALPEES